MTDQQALSRVLRQFARTMTSSFDINEALSDLSDSLVEVLAAADAAGVALLDGDDLRFVTATNDAGAEAERIQERLQIGPCHDSIKDKEPVVVDDLRACPDRWPGYTDAIDEVGFRAVLGIPLVLEDRRVGSLDVYGTEPCQWSEEAIDAAQVLADVGAAYVVNASELARAQRTAEQLQEALDSRVIIEQAKGALGERLGISPEEAFRLIRTSARRQGIKVALVCRRVIDTDHIPH